MPNAVRSFSAPDPFRAAAAAGPASSGPTLQLGAQKVTAASPSKVPRTPGLPPALARALEPKLERAISLQISDFIDHVPAGYMKPVEILDPASRVSLKASEIEKGMPEKHPSISLPSLYQQVPEIFIRGVRPDDETKIFLPYEAVLQQFENLHVRADQLREPAVPHVETPILTATVQDSKRFGTKIEPIEASTLPPVPVEPATAHTIAAAQPEAIVQEKTVDKTTPSGQRVISLHSPELGPKSEPPPLKPIPFDLSPNGTGAFASERVPASSGPPVPTTLPFSPELAKIATQPLPGKTATFEAAKILPAPTKLTEKEVSLLAPDERKIALGLKTVLQNVPVFQLTGAIGSVEDEERIEFPLNTIESQLASGRISISAEAFQAALPEKHRSVFQIDAAKTPVLLPLEEVLKNLPATVLKLRDDQEQFNLDKDFETPFLTKAREDSERFRAEPAKPAEAPSNPAELVVPEAKVEINAAEPAKPEKEIDPKEFVAEACALASVKACAITFADGLSLAGNLPDELDAEGLCAMAPPFLARIDQHMRASKLGPLVTMTLHSSDTAISFFAKENICLTVLHASGEFAPETQSALAALTSKLSRIYTKSE